MSNLSVIVCTYNRAEGLKDVLQSLQRCRRPENWQVECMVVDNASTDNTKQTVEMISSAGPVFKYVYAAKQGLSCARNAGLRASKGDLIAFTDDDCLAPEDWMEKLAEVAQEQPDIAGWFGQVRAADEDEAGRLMAHKTEAQPRRYVHPQSPVNIGHGNNMAFRREVFQTLGLFDEALGAGGPLRAAEDLDMAYRILRAGKTLQYDPRLLILHKARDTEAQVRATHWRNAVGMGACFGKHWARGDGYALKNLYWMWSGTFKSCFRSGSGGESAATKRAYLAGLPYGVLLRLAGARKFRPNGWEVPLA